MDLAEKIIAKMKGEKPKMDSPNDQSPAEKELASYVRNRIDEIRNTATRLLNEGQWLTNTAYLLGYTNMYYDTTARVFRSIATPNRNNTGKYLEFNYILPNIQNRLSRLTKTPPRYAVKPNSTSDEDREAARLGLYIINQAWDKQKVNKKRLTMTMAMQQYGHAFFKVVWDPSLGPSIPFVDYDKDGEEVIKHQRLGDVRIDVCSPFEVFVDPLATSMEEVNYIIHAKIRPISYFRTQYPKRGHLVEPEGVWLQSLEYQSRINTFNAQVGTGSAVGKSVENSAIELMLYEKPSYKYPQGRHVIVANGIVLKDDELPIDEIPFAKFDDIVVAGKFNSESVITHLRSLQDQYNRNISKRAQWLNRMLNGKYMAAKSHGLKSSALNDQSGEVVEYDIVPGAAPPTAMQTPSIPQYAYNEDDYTKGMMNEISGVGEISKGNLPSAGIPAIGMQFLQEMDDTRIGTITENNEYGYADLGRFILKFVENYYDYPRTLKVAGKGMEYAVKSFKGEDVRGNTDVTVVRGSTLPGSKVLRRQEIINLHQQGYLGDPQDPQVLENVLQMLEYGEIGEVWKDYSLDKQQIERHINMIENEMEPPVSEFDNHPMFIKEYNRYRKSDKFEFLSPMSQGIMLKVMELHLQQLTDIQAPETSDEGTGLDPNAQMSTAAQEMEAELQQELAMDLGEGLPGEELPPGEEMPLEGE